MISLLVRCIAQLNILIINGGTEKKKSTNGVWLVPNKSYEIYDGINFKILGCSKCVIRIKD